MDYLGGSNLITRDLKNRKPSLKGVREMQYRRQERCSRRGNWKNSKRIV